MCIEVGFGLGSILFLSIFIFCIVVVSVIRLLVGGFGVGLLILGRWMIFYFIGVESVLVCLVYML